MNNQEVIDRVNKNFEEAVMEFDSKVDAKLRLTPELRSLAKWFFVSGFGAMVDVMPQRSVIMRVLNEEKKGDPNG